MPPDGARVLVGTCAGLRAGERALVLCDAATRPVGEAIVAAARERAEHVRLVELAPLRMHGEEPPDNVAALMREADVVLGATGFSLAHTRARARASAAGARYLSLPDLTLERLARPALSIDFRALTAAAEALAARFTAGGRLHLTSAAGTDLRCSIDRRAGNAAPGWCDSPGGLASPPDAEANVPPLESASQGVVVVDGSIPHPAFGLVREPLRLEIEDGIVRRIDGARAGELEAVFASAGDGRARVVAEIGVGLNPAAELCGAMLEDEGCAGTVHVGIGANTAIGGANAVPFHLDVVLRAPTLLVDDAPVVQAGVLT